MSRKALLLFAAASVIWGSSFLFIRVAVEHIPPAVVVFSRTALLARVWGDDRYVTERSVDTVVSRLRRKVEHDPHDPRLIAEGCRSETPSTGPSASVAGLSSGRRLWHGLRSAGITR